jgi:hypothetical protein
VLFTNLKNNKELHIAHSLQEQGKHGLSLLFQKIKKILFVKAVSQDYRERVLEKSLIQQCKKKSHLPKQVFEKKSIPWVNLRQMISAVHFRRLNTVPTGQRKERKSRGRARTVP